MEFEKEPTDEQLDDLLRDVSVSEDLKSRLKQISAQSAIVEPNKSRSGSNPEVNGTFNRNWLPLVLAASLIGIGLFVASQYWPSGNNGSDPANEIVENETAPSEIITPDPSAAAAEEFELALAKFQAGQEQLDAAIGAVEKAQLEAQLANLNQSSAFQLNQREVESMIAAMSEEYSIPLGKPESLVKTKMAQVIKQFPGTRGAKIAQDYLSEANN